MILRKFLFVLQKFYISVLFDLHSSLFHFHHNIIFTNLVYFFTFFHIFYYERKVHYIYNNFISWWFLNKGTWYDNKNSDD